MRTIAILPIKSFSAAKQRLAGPLGGGSRRALAQAMFCDVLGALRHVRRLDAIAVVTADHTAESAAYGQGVEVLSDRAQAGQSQAAAIGIRHALDSGFERVLLVPGDTPLAEPDELAELLERSQAAATAAAIVPDRHGTGTNALLLSPPDALEPSFGPGSLERHVTAARDASVAHAVEPLPSLVLDIDTPEDLQTLASALGERRGRAPLTRGALRQIERLHPSAVGSGVAEPERAALGV